MHSLGNLDDPLVFFDLGMVLVHFQHETAVTQLAEFAGRSADLVRQIAFDSGLEDRFETGTRDPY